MSTPQHPTPAGWYPDPAGPGSLRYWDGTTWTPHRQPTPLPQAAPSAVVRPLRRSPGVDTNTVWIWLIVLMPLISMAMLLFVPWREAFDYSGVVDDPARMLEASLRIYTTPMYWVSVSTGLIIYGLAAWFAFLDHRTLTARGIDQPFPWAWQFLSPVYVIGRSIVVHRRTGGGIAPLWVLGAMIVASLTLSVVVSWIAVDAAISSIIESIRFRR